MNNNLQAMPSGHDGEGFITINGNLYPAFKYAKLSLKADAVTENKRFLNQRTTQTAVRGLNITGSISYYACTSALIEAIRAYKDGGEYPEITIQGWAGVSGTGRCEVLASGVVINSIGLLTLDDSSDSASLHESDITANDFDILSKFQG